MIFVVASLVETPHGIICVAQAVRRLHFGKIDGGFWRLLWV